MMIWSMIYISKLQSEVKELRQENKRLKLTIGRNEKTKEQLKKLLKSTGNLSKSQQQNLRKTVDGKYIF
jgi:predicted RNase H-like nuclease (RuvC/YqgF family)